MGAIQIVAFTKMKATDLLGLTCALHEVRGKDPVGLKSERILPGFASHFAQHTCAVTK